MVKVKNTFKDRPSTVTLAEKDKFKQERERDKALKEKEKADREAEKERIRALKEAARNEKDQKRKEREAVEAERELKKKERELKRQQDEAEKEQKRKEKEAAEAEREQKRKEREFKRQQDEAEREQKRKEKEAAERKKQLVLQKQATIMDRLFRRKEPETPPPQEQQRPATSGSSPSPLQMTNESSPSSTTGPLVSELAVRIDEELKAICNKNEEELLRLHLVEWQDQLKHRASEPFQRWGVRRMPKVTVSRELRLQGAGMTSSHKIGSGPKVGILRVPEVQTPSLKRKREEYDILDDVKVELETDDDCILLNEDPCNNNPRKKLCNQRWKLLQFDKSHRPAYYGTFSKKSSTIGARHPLRKDPSLDYEVDSDEEWEEEDPGESLSDCEDKEDDVDKIDSEVDEDSGDGFVVPDGYLSDNEGVRLEEADMEDKLEVTEHESSWGTGPDSRSPTSLEQVVQKHQRLMKLLDNVTKNALHRNRPFMVCNMLQQPGAKDANAENQTERLCFQALRVRVVAPQLVIEPPTDRKPEKEQDLKSETTRITKPKEVKKRKRQDVEVLRPLVNV